jgi:hypothetical protein
MRVPADGTNRHCLFAWGVMIRWIENRLLHR